ncbi:uncharacterized protein LOC142352181 isoform X2 [Convolutriloba macropyga]|uniref:uncharacterized protein LOC142352181 isoform X2 n=1 Tax=Convolutriloba macropyga TaxID=536237 RepID=UPI003F525951
MKKFPATLLIVLLGCSVDVCVGWGGADQCEESDDCRLLAHWLDDRDATECCIDNKCWKSCTGAVILWVFLRVVLPILCLASCCGVAVTVIYCIVKQQRRAAEKSEIDRQNFIERHQTNGGYDDDEDRTSNIPPLVDPPMYNPYFQPKSTKTPPPPFPSSS